MLGQKNTKSRKPVAQRNRRMSFERLEGRELMAVDVLLLAANPDSNEVADVALKLTKTGLLGKIDTRLNSDPVLSLTTMQQYSSILVWSNHGGFAPAWGDALADYLQQGGGVVTGLFTNIGIAPYTDLINGDWQTNKFNPFDSTGNLRANRVTLGNVLHSNHPIMNNVDAFDGGTSGYHTDKVSPGVDIIADWSDGNALIVESHPASALGTIIGLNFFPASSDAMSSNWDSRTDGALIMANSLVYAAGASTPGLHISNLVSVAPDPRKTPVGSIEVDFSEAIDTTTFTRDDLTLTKDGGANLITNAVTIVDLGNNHFSVQGLSKLTTAEGKYSFTVNAAAINNAGGQAGHGSRFDNWTVDTTGPIFNGVVEVTPNLRTGTGKPVPSIDFKFNEAMDLSSFNLSNITLTRDSGVVPLDASVTFSLPTPDTVRVNGLANFTAASGSYAFALRLTNAKDLAGNSRAGYSINRWVANDPPTLTLGGNIVYREGAAPLPLAAFATVTDADSPSFVKGKLTVSISGNAGANDVLSVISRNQGPLVVTHTKGVVYEGRLIGLISGGTAGAPLVIAFGNNNASSPAAVQALVTNIAFSSSEDFLQPASRQVSFVLDDGEGGISRTVFKTISIVPVNSAPKLTVDATTNYTLNTAAVLLAPNAKLVDNDSPSFNTGSLRVSIKTNGDRNEDLQIGGAFTASSSELFYGGKLVGYLFAGGGTAGKDLFIRFNTNSTRDVVEQLVKSITFRTVGSISSLNRHISFLVRDNAGATNEAFTDVNCGA